MHKREDVGYPQGVGDDEDNENEQDNPQRTPASRQFSDPLVDPGHLGVGQRRHPHRGMLNIDPQGSQLALQSSRSSRDTSSSRSTRPCSAAST